MIRILMYTCIYIDNDNSNNNDNNIEIVEYIDIR